MTQEQFRNRVTKAREDVFVITECEEGWRVRSVRNPSSHYIVSSAEEGVTCSCPDFQSHAAEDPSWVCKHILAVQEQQGKEPPVGPYESTERAAIREERPAEPITDTVTDDVHVVLKRSVSPDGRIDSLSIEVSFTANEGSLTQLKSRAAKLLKLQGEIAKGFLKANGKTEPVAAPQPINGDAAAFARLLDVGITNGENGGRFFINVQVGSRRARLFGNAYDLARAITTAGERLVANQVEPGMRLNLPCRVVTKPSADGKYLNVTRVLSANGAAQGSVQ